MPSQQFDTFDLENLDIPYDRHTKELDDRPRIVDGKDVFIRREKIRKRPALRTDDVEGTFVNATHRVDRALIYETLENPSQIFLVASLFNKSNSDWELAWIEMGVGSPTWTIFPNTRDCNDSTQPHEMVVSNGLLYIRGVPVNAAADPYGTIIFDGTGLSPTVKLWGLPTPTTAAAVTSQAGWPATTDTTVTAGWTYSYSLVSSTGQVSSRAPTGAPAGQGGLSTSNTGAVTNKKPQVTLQGDADTTNIPTVRVWRTFDGGGNYVFLEDVANPGAGGFLYTDDSFTGSKPKPDSELNPNDLSPGTTTNDPPPPVIFPDVIGTDDPVQSSTQIVEYSGRIWYGIGNTLVFSGNEEIINGSPRESFVSGQRGNFVRFKNELRYLESTKEALFIVTSQEVLWLRGTDRKSFFIRPLLRKIGGSPYKKAHTAIGDQIAFFTQDLKVALVDSSGFRGYLSQPLDDDVESLITTNTDIEMDNVQHDGGFYISLSLYDKSTPANSRLWVFDTERRKWNPPWHVPVSAMENGQYRKDILTTKQLYATDDGSATKVTATDETSSQDQYASSPSAWTIDFTMNLMRNPAGNHLNALRRPAHHSTLGYVKTERTKFASDADPTLEYRLDDFSAALTASTPEAPPYINQSTSHTINWWPVVKNAQRVQVKISKASLDEEFELQTFGLIFQPEGGA